MTSKIFLGLAVALCLFLSTQGLSLRQRRQAQVEAEAEAEARPCMDDEGGKYIEREFEGSCYTVVIKGMSKRGIPRRTSYARAAQVCQNSFDGGLARIESTAERDFVFNQLATTTNLSWVDGQFDNGVWNYFQYDDALQTQQLSTDMLNEESGQEGEALVLDNRCRLRGLDRTRTIGYICERSLAVEEQTTPAMSEQEEEEEVAELMEETEDDTDAAEDGNGTEVDASQGEVAAFFANANALEGEETTPEAEVLDVTTIRLEKNTVPGEYVFFRGGDKQGQSIPMAVVAVPEAESTAAYAAWSQGDLALDWQGPESTQETFNNRMALGTPAVWTEDQSGKHVWLVNLLMDCSLLEDGEFQVKGVLGKESYPHYWEYSAWEHGNNHVAKCGEDNSFVWGQ